jgi:hypothetical protein
LLQSWSTGVLQGNIFNTQYKRECWGRIGDPCQPSETEAELPAAFIILINTFWRYLSGIELYPKIALYHGRLPVKLLQLDLIVIELKTGITEP